jgi:hypothetical protein
MQINAKWIDKIIRVELPYDSSDMQYLEKFLRSEGFVFDKRSNRFEYEYEREDDKFTVTWAMTHTLRMTVLNTFMGRIIPMEDSIKQIVYPLQLKINYILEMDDKELDTIIKILFKNHFEIVSISQGGGSQLYAMKKNGVLIYKSELGSSKTRMKFVGNEYISRPIFNSFCIS